VRPSRLFASTTKYVLLQGANVLRITALYKPLKIFSILAALFVLCGAALGLRFLGYYLFGHNPGGHVQSLILAAVLTVIGFQTFLIALLGDLVAINRTMLEEMKLREGPDPSPAHPQDRSPVASSEEPAALTKP
jgi:hypothetical protein